MIRSLLRVMGAVAVFCSVLLFLTFTFVVVKRVWFGGHSGGHQNSSKGQVAVVDLNGIILNSHKFLQKLQDTLDDSSVKAIVLRVDSPGGLVAPSQEIYAAVSAADKKVPVIVSMQSLAASGGYYAAVAGRHIFANPGTFTASVGVIMEFMNTEKLYHWAKIERYVLKAGKFKDIGSPLKEMTADERKLLTDMLTDVHAEFRRVVKERRHLTDADVENYLDGRVMTGSQAKVAKLVDTLGPLSAAIAFAKKAGNLPEDATVKYPDENQGLLKRVLFGEDEDSKSLWGLLFSSLNSVSLPMSHSGWQVMLLAPIR